MVLRRQIWLAIALVLTAAALTGAGSSPAASEKSKVPGLEFLGQAIVPTGTQFEGTEVGGLSSITYDAGRGVYYSISDDPSQLSPARFYTLRLDVSDGNLSNGDVDFLDVTTLKGPDGQPFPPLSLDPEGLAYDAKDGTLIATSEGFSNRLIDPWV